VDIYKPYNFNESNGYFECNGCGNGVYRSPHPQTFEHKPGCLVQSQEIERTRLLRHIRCRMELQDIFYLDIWDRLLLTKIEVLREIEGSNFDIQVLQMKAKK